jgi:hypothetical protein
VRCYDNGGESADRYTVCFTGNAGTIRDDSGRRWSQYRGMSAHPRDPQGFGQWGENCGPHLDVNASGFAPAIGRKCHLGTRIPFASLPPDCRRLVLDDYVELWGIEA